MPERRSTTTPGPTTTAPDHDVAPDHDHGPVHHHDHDLDSVPSTTTVPPTTTTTVAPTTPPPVIPAPLVSVDTMAEVGGAQGVELRSYVQAALPCRGKVIQSGLGQACFYADPGLGRQWVQLLVLDRQDLSLVRNSSVNCPLASTKGEKAFDSTNSCTADLARTISGLSDADLVIAVNQPGASADRRVQPPVGLGAVLSGKVTSGSNNGNLGIEATAWFDAAQKGKWGPYAVRGTFSAIGVPGWTSHGVWAMPAQPDQGGKGALAANIAVDNDAFYSPLVPASSADLKNSPVVGVLTQAPAPWPKASSGEKAAISAIGTKVGLGSNPRAQYYSSLNQEVDWLPEQDAINGLKYSDFSTKKFDAQDFEAAQQELSREIGYVIDVEKYASELAMPYQGASTTLWSSFIGSGSTSTRPPRTGRRRRCSASSGMCCKTP